MPFQPKPAGLFRLLAPLALCFQLAGCAGIATQPSSETVLAGQQATFTVVGESTTSGATLTYQWYQNGTAIPGATAASYSFTATNAENGDTYYVIVSDGSSTTATSNTVTLTITPALSSVAGGLGGPGAYDSATPSTARFTAPYGVATDSSGNVYVADTSNNTIRKITPAGAVSTLAGTPGQAGSTDGTGAAALFRKPRGIAVDSNGNVYVADTLNETIRKITSAGVVTTLASTAGQGGSTDGTGAAAAFNGPWGLAVDASGNVYVADTNNDTIRKVTATGVVTTIAGSAGQEGYGNGSGSAARFAGPEGLALNPSTGAIMVVDTYNAALRQVTTAGVVTTVVQGAFAQAMADAVDNQGNTYVSDSLSNLIYKVSSSGTVTTYVGSSHVLGTTNGSLATATFYSPAGLALDSAGDLFVADSGDSQSGGGTHYGVQGGVALFDQYQGSDIREITAAGQVSTLAGSIAQTGSGNGTAAAARFFGPYGMAFDPSGNAYVADSQNDTIRKLAGGAVSTFAGTPGNYAEADGVGSAASFGTPSAMAADASGNLYVTDTGLGTVRKISTAGSVSTLAGQGKAGLTLSQPSGITVDASGNVYVADTLNHCIHEILPAGTASTYAGTCGSGASVLSQPSALGVDSSGNIYVADAGNDTIEKISSGTVSTLAGTVGKAGSANGTGTAATFSSPQGIAVDSAGDVYVADTQNSLIRKITSAGVVTTVVGTTGVASFLPGAATSGLIAYPKQLAINGQTLYITTDNAVVAVTPLP